MRQSKYSRQIWACVAFIVPIFWFNIQMRKGRHNAIAFGCNNFYAIVYAINTII